MYEPVFLAMKPKAGARAITAGASINEYRGGYQRLIRMQAGPQQEKETKR
jgi:hypothetical protein